MSISFLKYIPNISRLFAAVNKPNQFVTLILDPGNQLDPFKAFR
jgi:hypothetical protein